MFRSLTGAVAASLLIAGCGGGQTQPTEAEEALGDEFQPAAPSPGGDVSGRGGGGNAAAPAPAGQNAQ